MMVLPFILLVVAALVTALGLRRVSVWVWLAATAAMLYTLSLRTGDFANLAL